MPASDDIELRRRLLRLRRELVSRRTQEEKPPDATTPEEAVKAHLGVHGSLVLEAVREQYPALYGRLVKELARLLQKGELKEITGPWLRSILARLGYPLRLRTRIRVMSDGKAISLVEKLRGQESARKTNEPK